MIKQKALDAGAEAEEFNNHFTALNVEETEGMNEEERRGVCVLGSGAIWQYLGTRLKIKTFQRKEELQNNDGVQYRDDLKDRVRNLESLLASSSDEKDELRTQVLLLTQEVSALRVKVEFLERENDRLKG